ncbi:MAG: 2-oxoacid:acceptor oxidoreductase family protein [Planctomycetota bacterium]|nr:2-oxoacid:acceptor oxidoreductase family protein [Planctomycetota bacterium]MDA1142381.1 2-oxoacid:acceptor oxidoreductase family protein [Planctomycetota bacterium]
MSASSSTNGNFPYPGVKRATDGAGAVVQVVTNVTQAAAAYPITSSTTMGGGYSMAAANGMENLWGDEIEFIELESEHSSASTCEGFAIAGGRVTNFTSGQGLVLMKEVLYTISGKRLPTVFHIGARALTSHSLNVHAGHDDVMSCADCGWGIVFGRNAQEAGDLALIVTRAAEACQSPFMNVQDGFLTTHTVENVYLLDPEFMKEYVGKPEDKILNLYDVDNPLMIGVVQDQDSYMKGKIAQRHYYAHMRPSLIEAMEVFYKGTGRQYGLIDTYKMEDADYAFVGMGSYMETAEAAIDYIRENTDYKVGCVNITSYRPFPSAEIVEALKDVKAFSVLERMDDPIAPANPLMRDIKTAFVDAMMGFEEHNGTKIENMPLMIQVAAGLGSRDVRAGDFLAICKNMHGGVNGEDFKEYATIGIIHETALVAEVDPDVRHPEAYSMRGHSIGGYGSVTTNKVIADLMSDLFGLYVQAYPKYGSSKKGLPTTYYLTLAPEHVKTHCELNHVEFISLIDTNSLNLGDPLRGLAPNGTVFINTPKETIEEVWKDVPVWARGRIREKNARVLAVDTFKIADEIARNPELRIRMMGVVLVGVFLKATPFAKRYGMSYEDLMEGVERSVRSYWGKRGEAVVQDNLACIRRGYTDVLEIPQALIQDTKSDTKAHRAVNMNTFVSVEAITR